MDDLFGIQFISRENISTEFTVPNTELVHKNWKLILATLTFYSVALAETTSDKDGFFTYMKEGQVCRKSIPAACRDFLERQSEAFSDEVSGNEVSEAFSDEVLGDEVLGDEVLGDE